MGKHKKLNVTIFCTGATGYLILILLILVPPVFRSPEGPAKEIISDYVGQRARFPYASFITGKAGITVEGLPDGVELKELARMSLEDLKIIHDNSSSIAISTAAPEGSIDNATASTWIEIVQHEEDERQMAEEAEAVVSLTNVKPAHEGKYSFERLHLVKIENLKKYGPIYKEKLGPGINVVQVYDPEDIQQVFRYDGRLPCRPPMPITIVANKRDGVLLGLGSLNGEAWYALRKSVQQLMMHPRAASVYLPAQNAVADDFLSVINQRLESNGHLHNFEDIILRYTMESIGTVCFDTRLGCLGTSTQGDSAENMITATKGLFQSVQMTTFAFPWYALFKTPLYKQFIRCKAQTNSIALQHIKIAEQKCPVNETGADDEAEDKGPNFLHSLIKQGGISTERIVGITTELFTAGIDSTANALCFVMYNLGRYNEAQEKLAEEIHSVCPPGSEVTPEVFDKMPYMKACVKESFRLNFPIEGGTTRIPSRDITLGGYIVPKGTIVALNNQTMCLHEDYFDNPKVYQPERWLKAINKVSSPYVMLPFGHGPRMCIGRRFAEQEIYLAIIKIFGRFHVSYVGECEIGMLNRVFTMPDQPLKLVFRQR